MKILNCLTKAVTYAGIIYQDPRNSENPEIQPLNKIFVVQYSTVQHSTAQHSTAQHSTTQHSTVFCACTAILRILKMNKGQTGPSLQVHVY